MHKWTWRLKKKQESGQTLFDIQTKGTFENLPLFSPGSFDVTQEEKDPFFGSIFKSSHDDPEDIFTPSEPTRHSLFAIKAGEEEPQQNAYESFFYLLYMNRFK